MRNTNHLHSLTIVTELLMWSFRLSSSLLPSPHFLSFSGCYVALIFTKSFHKTFTSAQHFCELGRLDEVTGRAFCLRSDLMPSPWFFLTPHA